MSEKILFPKDVELGKFYLVPHVFAYHWYDGLKDIFIPINSPKHGDKEYIGVAALHYHVDWRFLNTRIYNRVCSNHWCENGKIRNEAAFAVFEDKLCTGLKEPFKQIEDKIEYRKVRCKRPYSVWRMKSELQVMYNSWPIKMQAGFCGQKLRLNEQGQYVCPHKGAIIDLKHVDEEGNIVCPAHQLRFNSETLTAI